MYFIIDMINDNWYD